jgi:hypothetical protein
MQELSLWDTHGRTLEVLERSRLPPGVRLPPGCAEVSRRAFPSCSMRSILTEIYPCHACSCHEIEVEMPGQEPPPVATPRRPGPSPSLRQQRGQPSPPRPLSPVQPSSPAAAAPLVAPPPADPAGDTAADVEAAMNIDHSAIRHAAAHSAIHGQHAALAGGIQAHASAQQAAFAGLVETFQLGGGADAAAFGVTEMAAHLDRAKFWAESPLSTLRAEPSPESHTTPAMERQPNFDKAAQPRLTPGSTPAPQAAVADADSPMARAAAGLAATPTVADSATKPEPEPEPQAATKEPHPVIMSGSPSTGGDAQETASMEAANVSETGSSQTGREGDANFQTANTNEESSTQPVEATEAATAAVTATSPELGTVELQQQQVELDKVTTAVVELGAATAVELARIQLAKNESMQIIAEAVGDSPVGALYHKAVTTGTASSSEAADTVPAQSSTDTSAKASQEVQDVEAANNEADQANTQPPAIIIGSMIPRPKTTAATTRAVQRSAAQAISPPAARARSVPSSSSSSSSDAMLSGALDTSASPDRVKAELQTVSSPYQPFAAGGDDDDSIMTDAHDGIAATQHAVTAVMDSVTVPEPEPQPQPEPESERAQPTKSSEQQQPPQQQQPQPPQQQQPLPQQQQQPLPPPPVQPVTPRITYQPNVHDAQTATPGLVQAELGLVESPWPQVEPRDADWVGQPTEKKKCWSCMSSSSSRSPETQSQGESAAKEGTGAGGDNGIAKM